MIHLPAIPETPAVQSTAGSPIPRHAAGAPAAPLYGLAAALCLSRLYLGVHYPSDVLGGALLGDAIGRVGSR